MAAPTVDVPVAISDFMIALERVRSSAAYDIKVIKSINYRRWKQTSSKTKKLSPIIN